MSFLGSVGKTLGHVFSQPQNILIPPLGIAEASIKLATPLVASSIGAIKGAIANGAISPASDHAAMQSVPFQTVVENPYPSYPNYSVYPSGSFLTNPGGSPWDSSTSSLIYPAGITSAPSPTFSPPVQLPQEQQVISYLTQSLNPFQ